MSVPGSSLLRWVAPRLALVLASVAVTLLALEGGLRLAGSVQHLDYRVYLQDLVNPVRVPLRIWHVDPVPLGQPGHIFKYYPPFLPGVAEVATTSEYSVVYQINAHGWRDRESDYEKPPGTTRVLALGDSFTFGVAVPYGERFTEVAEDRLHDVDIVNMGVPGYGLDNAVLAFIADGMRYHPDAVAVFLNRYVVTRQNVEIVTDGVVHIPYDVTSAISSPKSNAETFYLRPDDPLLTASSALVRHSYLLSYASYRLRLWQLHERLVAVDAAKPVVAASPGPTIVDANPGHQTRTTALLTTLRDRCVAAHARLIVFNIDDFVSYPYVGKIPGLVYHDLADELHRRDLAAPLRFRFDLHYTPATNRFIGERVAAFLRDDLAAPPGS